MRRSIMIIALGGLLGSHALAGTTEKKTNERGQVVETYTGECANFCLSGGVIDKGKAEVCDCEKSITDPDPTKVAKAAKKKAAQRPRK